MKSLGKQDKEAQVEVLVHDLRNEINVIGFACSALRLQARDGGAEVSRSLTRIEAAYARCAELLVSFSRDRQGSPAPPDADDAKA